jgi:hypothetical protein
VVDELALVRIYVDCVQKYSCVGQDFDFTVFHSIGNVVSPLDGCNSPGGTSSHDHLLSLSKKSKFCFQLFKCLDRDVMASEINKLTLELNWFLSITLMSSSITVSKNDFFPILEVIVLMKLIQSILVIVGNGICC